MRILPQLRDLLGLDFDASARARGAALDALANDTPSGDTPLLDGSIGDEAHHAAPAAAGINAHGAPGAGSGGITLEATTVDTTLQIGIRDTGDYGNKFNWHTDADGIVTAGFAGTGQDLILSFKGFDIDFADEVEVLLNGTSLGYLAAGVDGGLASYQFMITAAQQQAGDNVISFVQRGNVSWAWGVTDILLETAGPATTLTVGVTDTGSYGNNFAGKADSDGVIQAVFAGTGEDLVLSFDGYDIDFPDEVEVLLNGTSLGFLAAGVNNGLASYQFAINAGQQVAGDNVISFVQRGDVTWAWGVKDILLEPADPVTTLAIGVTDTGTYGNNFAGTSDGDGVVKAAFTSTGQDLLLSLKGYDIDMVNEVEVLLNGTSIGFLQNGVDNGLSSHQFFISAAQQQAGDNVISFVQRGDVNWTWGVTDILLTEQQPDAAISLTVGVSEQGSYGNNFNGSTEIDGQVTASFTGTGQDLLLSFSGYDIDFSNEVEVLLNGTSLGYLTAGVNDGLASYQFLITAAEQLAGDNVITFAQRTDVTWKWGVTDILLEPVGPVTTLTPGVTDGGSYGNNFAGSNDSDGVVQAVFDSNGKDLLLTFDGFDIDMPNEVEVLLNGTSLGFLQGGVDNGLSAHEFFISAAQQQAGTNTISFVQRGDVTWTWGVTNILIDEIASEAPIALQMSVTETGKYGNNFDGSRDFDGVIDATFTGTNEDVTLKFNAYDVDFADEIEVLLNGTSLGFLSTGVDNGLSSYEFVISAAQQQAGTNTISFVQRRDVNWTWGITDIQIDPVPPSFTPTDSGYAQQWHLHEIGALERIWADYTGTGVAVGIYDDGLQYTHHDLDGNYDASMQVVVGGQVVDPLSGASQHGTSVAGVIAAEADGVGTVGVAFGASITGVNIFSGAASANAKNLSGFGEAMMQMANFDVVNHSWGWSPPFVDDSPPKDVFYATTLPTVENAAVNGRGGLGTIIVKSAGNGFESSQGELLDATRYTINVGATDNDGDIAWYSNHGANLLVTAPSSGDQLFNLGVMTTDLLGTAGYAAGDYTGTDGFTGFGGTSSAAPVVTGVVALMLDANPDLGWRDVQSILAYSATHAGTAIDATPLFFLDEEHIWRFNGADNWNGGGLHVSEDYGFGDVDAFNAVRMAEVWHYFGAAQTSANEATVSRSDALNMNIGTLAAIDLDLTGVSFAVDHAQVSVSLSDSTVDIFLVSPDGTQVELYRSGDAPAGALDWTFGAQLFRGESADGIWSLEIVNSDGSNTTLTDYSVDWWGRADGLDGFSVSDDVYHFTDEIFASNIFDVATGQFTAIVDDAARTTLTDADGGTDWLDMAAMTGNLDVSLVGGATGTSSGQVFLTVATGTDIENAVGGDGHDRLSGNAGDNVLVGMRGNDQLFGQDGSDQLTGGSGNDDLWGGLGDDLFVFEDGFGLDVIHDFEAALAGSGSADAVDFKALTEVSDFSAVMSALTDSAQGAVYDFGADGQNVLVFEGLSVVDLSANDFLFV